MAPSITDTAYEAPASVPTKATPKATLEKAIRDHELVPLWNTGAPPTAPEPRSKHIPALWKYRDTKALLLEAAEVVDAKEAERRAVLMINPGPRQSPHTLDTILAAHQLLIPGEKAVCHRHTPFAVRFLIEGSAGYTAISGRKMYMAPGDLIITPSWNWHDHGNEGTDNVIWLDGLNIPLFKHIPVDFTQHYDEMYGVDTHPSRPVAPGSDEADGVKFAWTDMRDRLLAAGREASFAREEYLGPGGKSVSTTIGAYMTRVGAGRCAVPMQETASSIYQVHAGSGYTRVWKSSISAAGGEKEWDGSEERDDAYTLRWQRGDSFCVPAWYRYQIFADGGDGDEDAYLFSFSDKPMQVALGFWRGRD